MMYDTGIMLFSLKLYSIGYDVLLLLALKWEKGVEKLKFLLPYI